MKEKKMKKKFNTQELKEKRHKVVTMKFNEIVYKKFQSTMKEQGLVSSAVINQFMKLTNDLLQNANGGEVAFIFEPTKEEDSKK